MTDKVAPKTYNILKSTATRIEVCHINYYRNYIIFKLFLYGILIWRTRSVCCDKTLRAPHLQFREATWCYIFFSHTSRA